MSIQSVYFNEILFNAQNAVRSKTYRSTTFELNNTSCGDSLLFYN